MIATRTMFARLPRVGLLLAALLGPGLPGASAQEQSPEDRPIRVACLGDNLTAGTGLANPDRDAYPARLAALLGAGWEVHTLAAPGITMMAVGSTPLYKQNLIPNALRLEPDVIIMLFGTNDSKAPNWQHADRFVRDYRDLITSFLGREPAPSLWVALPPPAFGEPADGVQPAVIRDEILPRLREVVKGLPVVLLDLNTPLQDQAEHFPDGVNPNETGAARLAELVHAAIQLPARRDH